MTLARYHGPRARPGHSLPELIVAVTFLATTGVAVGSMAVVGAHWTSRAVARQEAVRVAAAVLDSVASVPGTGVGTAEIDGFAVSWTEVAGGRVRVEVSVGAAPAPLVVLRGPRIPQVPILPDSGGLPGDREGPL